MCPPVPPPVITTRRDFGFRISDLGFKGPAAGSPANGPAVLSFSIVRRVIIAISPNPKSEIRNPKSSHARGAAAGAGEAAGAAAGKRLTLRGLGEGTRAAGLRRFRVLRDIEDEPHRG